MIGDVLAQISNTSFEGFIALLQEHELLASVLIQFFGGDLAIHMFGVLYGSGEISILPIVIALSVIFVFDILVYHIVRTLKRSEAILKHARNIRFFKKVETFFKKHEERYNKSPTLLLIAIKLLPLTKLTLIFFALSQKMSTVQFILRNSAISVIWFAVLFVPGWLVGRGLLAQEAGIQASNFIIYFSLLIIIVILFNKKIDQILMQGIDKIASAFGKNKDAV